MPENKVKQNDEFKAVVLAAGLGKRMLSTTAKVLHPVLGKPIIWRVLKALDKISEQIARIEEIHIVIGHNAQEVEDYVNQCIAQNNFHRPIFFHQQKEQLGTGHALMAAQEVLKDFDGHLVVVPGDAPLLNNSIFGSLFNAHLKNHSNLTILSAELADPTGYGRILRTNNDEITGIIEEKDASSKEKQIKEIGTSIYCFDWRVINNGLKELKNNNKQGEYYLTDLIAWSVRSKHRVTSYTVSDWRLVMGVNSRLELQLANKFLNQMVADNLMQKKGVTIIDPASTWIAPEVNIATDTIIFPGCWLVGEIEIGKGCSIGPNTSIEGKVKIGDENKIVQSHLENCHIGNACYIGPFAHLREGAVLTNKVRIGNFVEVKMSSIDELSAVSHLSYIGDSKIGKDTNIGAGTITANYDHFTKLKSSTVIEDGVSIGSNSVLVAPVRIGKNSAVAAGTVITKDVEPEALAVRRVKQDNIAGWTKKRKQEREKNKNC